MPFPRHPPVHLAARALSLAVRMAPTGRKLYHYSILLRKVIPDIHSAAIPDGYECVWAGPDEICYMDAHPEATSSGAYERRARRGDRCLCVKKGNQLVGYQWTTRRSCCFHCGMRSELIFLPLKDNQAFTYDLYVYKAYRRRGIATLITELMFQTLKQNGIHESFNLVAPENKAALKLHLRAGREPYCMVYGFCIRHWSKTFFGPREDDELKRWVEQFKLRSGPG